MEMFQQTMQADREAREARQRVREEEWKREREEREAVRKLEREEREAERAAERERDHRHNEQQNERFALLLGAMLGTNDMLGKASKATGGQRGVAVQGQNRSFATS